MAGAPAVDGVDDVLACHYATNDVVEHRQEFYFAQFQFMGRHVNFRAPVLDPEDVAEGGEALAGVDDDALRQ